MVENAMNSCSSTRRSQAVVCAVTPAHGSGDGSSKATFTVDPILKSLSEPTVRQICGDFLKPNRNATLGKATRAAPIEPRVMLRRTRNFRRLTSGMRFVAAPDEG